MSVLSRFSALLGILMCIVGCQTKPKITHEGASEGDIRENIVGTWSGDNYSGEHLTLHFDADGAVLIQRAGAPDVHAFWRTDRSWLVVTPERDKPPTSSDGYWAVWHVDAHELSFRRGFSTGGPPYRFTRSGRPTNGLSQ